MERILTQYTSVHWTVYDPAELSLNPVIRKRTKEGIKGSGGGRTLLYDNNVDCMRKKTKIPAEQIARCIIDGKGNKEIAAELDKKKRTIDTYISRLFRRHGCNNRTQLAIKILNIVV